MCCRLPFLVCAGDFVFICRCVFVCRTHVVFSFIARCLLLAYVGAVLCLHVDVLFRMQVAFFFFLY